MWGHGERGMEGSPEAPARAGPPSGPGSEGLRSVSPTPGLTVENGNLPNGSTGKAYKATLIARGAQPPMSGPPTGYRWG